MTRVMYKDDFCFVTPDGKMFKNADTANIYWEEQILIEEIAKFSDKWLTKENGYSKKDKKAVLKALNKLTCEISDLMVNWRTRAANECADENWTTRYFED